MKNQAKAYLYFFQNEDDPITPVWYAGLGYPYKTSTDIRFASSVPIDSTGTHMLVKQLERYYGKTFHQVLLTDAVPTPHYRCAGCGFGWTLQEKEVARLYHGWQVEEGIDDKWVRKDLFATALSFTHLGSPMRRADVILTNSANIHHSRRCINEKCMELFCASCAPPQRGPNAGSCKICKPSRRRS